MNENTVTCPSCGQQRAPDQMRKGSNLLPAVAEQIAQSHPGWSPEQPVCEVCLRRGEADYMEEQLTKVMGTLTELEDRVLRSIRDSQLLTRNENASLVEEAMFAEQFAGQVAKRVGSWYFPLVIVLFILIWSFVNIIWEPFAPYPTIIFTVISAVLGGLAALYGPFILMSQRYQQERDRLRAQNDYLVNLKAELEIRYLHEKLDMLLEERIEPGNAETSRASMEE